MKKKTVLAMLVMCMVFSASACSDKSAEKSAGKNRKQRRENGQSRRKDGNERRYKAGRGKNRGQTCVCQRYFQIYHRRRI